MRLMSIILVLLVGTFFVACGKKSGGGGTPNRGYQQPYYGQGYGGSPYGPQGQGYPPYQGQQQQVNPGFNNQLKSCQSPMSSSLVQYCGWLATEAEETAGCDHDEVRQVFMQYCSQFANQMNFCVPQAQPVACVGCNRVYVSSTDYEDDYDYEDDVGPSTSTSTTTVVSRPSTSTAVTTSRPVVAKNTTKIVSCEVDIGLCRLIKGDRNRKLQRNILPSDKYLQDNLDRNNVECQIKGAGGKYYNYFAILNSCEQPKAEAVVQAPVQESVIVRPIADQAPVTVAPIADNVEPVKPVAQKDFLNKCFSLQERHEFLANPANQITSYSRKYISNPNARNQKLSDPFIKKVSEIIYIQDQGSVRQNPIITVYKDDPKNPIVTRQGSAIADTVKQSGDRLVVGNDVGEITRCNNHNFIEARFIDLDGNIRYTTYTWNGLDTDDGHIYVTTTGQLTAGPEKTQYLTSRLIVWGKSLTQKEIEKKAKKELEALDQLPRESGLDASAKAKLQNTLDVIKK